MSSRDFDERIMELGFHQPRVNNKPKRKPRLLIIGHGRHGKDTFAELLSDTMDLQFTSSSLFVGERCVWPAWGFERYDSFEACFDDRVNYRSTWGDLISAWNTPDKARTARTMLNEGNDMYVGMRRSDELEACLEEDLFDHIIWVDACDRLPEEPLNSMNLDSSMASIFIDNNGPESNLLTEVANLQDRLHKEGFSVNWTPEKPIETPKPDPQNVLIYEPTIFPMGQTQMDPEALRRWAEHNGLTDLMMDTETPLGRMWQDMEGEDSIARMIEFGGRHCYRAWEKGRNRADYIANIIEMNHGSVLEHSTVNWAIQGVSRSLSLELARHRVGIALSQESQRYVDASEINFVVPPIVSYLSGGATNADVITEFHRDNILALDKYKRLQDMIVDRIDYKVGSGLLKVDTMAKKRANEAARAHLPNATETRFLWTTNMRLLLHFLWLRGGSGADLEIRRLAVELLRHAQFIAPEIFNSMTTKEVDDGYGVPIIVAA